jgi:hypothetical protein
VKDEMPLSSGFVYSKVCIAFYLIFYFNAPAACATIQAQSGYFSGGTFIYFRKTDDYIVASVDSRVESVSNDLKPIGPYHDECKIAVLDEHTIFFSQGAAALILHEQGTRISADDIAREVFTQSQSAAFPVNEAANRFTQRIIDIYGMYYPMSVSIEGHALLYGIFAASSVDDLQAAQANIFVQNQRVVGNFLFSRGPSSPMFLKTHVAQDIFDEFDAGNTTRARQLYSEYAERFGNLTLADRNALKATVMVRAMINWSNDPAIGGDVSTVILEKGRPIRWYARADSCSK